MSVSGAMDKGLCLNKTNAGTIADLYGPETDAWIGRQIRLFATEVPFGAEQVLAIRVRMRAPKINDGKPNTGPSGIMSELETLYDRELIDNVILIHEVKADKTGLKQVRAHLKQNPSGCAKCALQDPFASLPVDDDGDPVDNAGEVE